MRRIVISKGEGGSAVAGVAYDDGQTRIECEGVGLAVTSRRPGGRTVLASGSPVLDGRIARDECAARALAGELVWRDLDGEFLLLDVDSGEGTLTIVNDRFASIPLYYTVTEERFYASHCYTDNATLLSRTGRFSIDTDAFWEFIHFKRLLGSRTFDNSTRFLDAASVLTVRGARITLERYWEPDYTVSRIGGRELARDLAGALSASCATKTSDGAGCALLLSGGLDSRAVLAASASAIPCLTIGETRNAEVRVAETVARAAGQPHQLVFRSPGYYGSILDEAVRLSGCMSVYNHAHFLCLGEAGESAEVLLHGHGLDYLFQGMYLPKREIRLFGARTAFETLEPLPADERLVDRFIGGAGFRMKSVGLRDLVPADQASRRDEALRESVREVYRRARGLTDDPYRIWQELFLHNISRHYTNLNLISMCKHYRQRTVAFDNRLFALYCRSPVSLLVSGSLLRRAVQLLNPRLARIENANTGCRLDAGPARLTLHHKLRGLAQRFGLPVPVKGMGDKSWPDENELLRRDVRLRTLVLSLGRSERLDGLGLLDMDAVGRCAARHVEGRGDHKDLLLSLITIDRFLEILS